MSGRVRRVVWQRGEIGRGGGSMTKRGLKREIREWNRQSLVWFLIVVVASIK